MKGNESSELVILGAHCDSIAGAMTNRSPGGT